MSLADKLRRYFLPYQIDWIVDDSPLKIYPKSRRIGVSFATSFRRVWKALQYHGHDCWVLSRDEGKAKEFIEYCKIWIGLINCIVPGIPFEFTGKYHEDKYVTDDDVTVLRITFPNGSRIMALSSNPDAIAGVGGSVVADEFALHKDQQKLFDVALPCITWGGQFEIISTHRGIETFFNELCIDAEADNQRGWSYHKTTIADAVAAGFVDKLNEVRAASGFPGFTGDTFIEDAKRQCSSEQAFLQEYMCEPSNLDDALIKWEWIEAATADVDPEPDPKYPCYLGVDVGRKVDLTVPAIVEKRPDRYVVKFIDRYDRMSFNDQRDKLQSIIEKYKPVQAFFDQTKIGENLRYRMELIYGSYRMQGVDFTNAIKENLAQGVRTAFDTHRITIPNDLKLKAALYAVQVEVSPLGIIRYLAKHTRDGHADEFWSIALAIAIAGPLEQAPSYAVSVPTVDHDEFMQQAIENWDGGGRSDGYF